MKTNRIYEGDCLKLLGEMEEESVDSIITDPPYGLTDYKPEEVVACLKAWIEGKPYSGKGKGFMGKEWDSWVPGPEVWRECLRVLKPGGHMLTFAGTRSMDLMSMAIRLSGFELRDSIGFAHETGGAPLCAWVYGSGFPKSLDISKAIDKVAGAEREVVGYKKLNERDKKAYKPKSASHFGCANQQGINDERSITAPATDAAKQYEGWGTALKPAWEPIILSRKPLIGTVAENVLEHGTGGLNIDECRVGTEEMKARPSGRTSRAYQSEETTTAGGMGENKQGRFPANVILDGSEEVLQGFPETKSGAIKAGTPYNHENCKTMGAASGTVKKDFPSDSGSAARYFYTAKASKKDRAKHNTHPTVKPVKLIEYLITLITPKGGVVLDPYIGSGTTAVAAVENGFEYIGFEISEEYIKTAQQRVRNAEPNLF